MAEKLTERSIERLTCPTGRKDALVFDAQQQGLGVRVMAGGSKSYFAQYTVAGQRRRVPLGNVDAISLAAARSAAGTVLGEVAKGLDPAAQRKDRAEAAKVAALRERMTVAQLVADWTRLHLAHRSPRYRLEAPATLQRVLGEWWGRPAERLERRDVVAVVDRLPPSMARAAAAYGRAAFAWAQKRGSVPANPFAALPVTLGTARRDRVLTDAEAARVWQAAAATPAPYGPIVRMLLLTGQRREEVSGMAWAEMSDDLRTWTIPGTRTKNGQPSVVPLPAPATALLRERLAAIGERRDGLVFPGQGGRAAFAGWSKAKLALDKAAGVKDWRLHDLRRTVATGLQRLGVRLEVTEAVLNHVSGSRSGIVGIYQRHDWAVEKRAALEGWAGHLLAAGLEGEGVVVRLRRRKV